MSGSVVLLARLDCQRERHSVKDEDHQQPGGQSMRNVRLSTPRGSTPACLTSAFAQKRPRGGRRVIAFTSGTARKRAIAWRTLRRSGHWEGRARFRRKEGLDGLLRDRSIASFALRRPPRRLARSTRG